MKTNENALTKKESDYIRFDKLNQPSQVILNAYPAIAISLEKNNTIGWYDSDGWEDRESWGDTGWGETV